MENVVGSLLGATGFLIGAVGFYLGLRLGHYYGSQGIKPPSLTLSSPTRPKPPQPYTPHRRQEEPAPDES